MRESPSPKLLPPFDDDEEEEEEEEVSLTVWPRSAEEEEGDLPLRQEIKTPVVLLR